MFGVELNEYKILATFHSKVDLESYFYGLPLKCDANQFVIDIFQLQTRRNLYFFRQES